METLFSKSDFSGIEHILDRRWGAREHDRPPGWRQAMLLDAEDPIGQIRHGEHPIVSDELFGEDFSPCGFGARIFRMCCKEVSSLVVCGAVWQRPPM